MSWILHLGIICACGVGNDIYLLVSTRSVVRLKHKKTNRLVVKESQTDTIIKDYHLRYAHMKRDKLYKMVGCLLQDIIYVYTIL
jgi:hypothetical protein